MQSIRPIFVTGACSGIGLALCKRLESAGQHVVSIDINDRSSELNSLDHWRCDLSDPNGVDTLIADLVSSYDLTLAGSLINVAGVPGTIASDSVIEVNTLAVRKLSRAFASWLSPGSSIVNVGSISGNGWQQRIETHKEFLALSDKDARSWWLDRENSIGIDSYSFSKEAVIVWTMRQAGELLGRGIRCNIVSPGPVETPLLPTFRKQIGDERLDWVISHAGRPAFSDEIAQAIEWLSTGESSWVNGHHLVVDGGYTSGLLSGWLDTTNAPPTRTS
jgi:NAD(P)-dependent dehydrogenase (short-subunit alcohol dehydrogenase family)